MPAKRLRTLLISKKSLRELRAKKSHCSAGLVALPFEDLHPYPPWSAKRAKHFLLNGFSFAIARARSATSQLAFTAFMLSSTSKSMTYEGNVATVAKASKLLAPSTRNDPER